MWERERIKYYLFQKGLKLSKLGMGAMRLPQTEPGFGKPVDIPKAQETIDFCMENGVNYYDTAYIYHGGMSETILGQALKKYPRESFRLLFPRHARLPARTAQKE